MEPQAHRGTLRVHLAVAPGAGKTWALAAEGHRRRSEGADVVVGVAEPRGRPEVARKLAGLEIVPPRPEGGLDVDAILARRPEVVLVDDLAADNPPGSRNPQRWQDVEELLEAGISVISTLDVHHLESLRDVAERITGLRVPHTVPDRVVREADEIQLLDVTPEALRRRLACGRIVPPERLDAGLANAFRPANLAALRELALRWLADRISERLRSQAPEERPWETRERVLVAVAGGPSDEALIRRGARMAARARGDLLCVHVSPPGAPPPDLDRARELVARLGGTFLEVVGEDVARALIDVARAEKATQLVVGSGGRSRLARMTGRSVVRGVIARAGPVDVHVISTPPGPPHSRRLPPPRPRTTLPPRRILAGWAVALGGAPSLTLVLASLRGHVGLHSTLLLYLVVVVAASATGGAWPGLAAVCGGLMLANYYFIPPVHTLTIGKGQDLLALVVFLLVAVVVSTLVTVSARRGEESRRARAEAEALARFAGALSGREDAVPQLLSNLRAAFSLECAAILVRDGERWVLEAASGAPVPRHPDEATTGIRISDDARLLLTGRILSADDRRVLDAFVAQLASALQSRRLRAEASAAAELAAANEMRTALLAAVSHDLRTPLASIKGTVTGLLEGDVEWSAETTRQLLAAVDAETDRLNKLVGNLLDMSRLQTGGLQWTVQEVGLDEVVAAALASLGQAAARVAVRLPEALPTVRADPALLERAVANLIDNALTHSPPGVPVRVEAGEVAGRAHLRIVDHGPGIPEPQRQRAFVPFERIGSNGSGVGLGLAVAKGFVEAMGGELSLEDTPGGGLTAVVSLQTVRP